MRFIHENIQGRYVLIVMISPVPWSFCIIHLLHITVGLYHTSVFSLNYIKFKLDNMIDIDGKF